MPQDRPTLVSRRRFVAASLGVATVVAAGGCALPEPDREPDALLPLAEAARRDALELGAADASHGSDAARLQRIGRVRGVHADRLEDEIRRLRTEEDDDEAAQSPASDPSAPVCPPIAQVRERLRADARRAAEVAVSAEGYRAELAAAVSAACTAALEVVLA